MFKTVVGAAFIRHDFGNQQFNASGSHRYPYSYYLLWIAALYPASKHGVFQAFYDCGHTGCYWMTQKLVELVLIWADIAPNGIGIHVPEWKFVLGLSNVEGYGTYSDEHVSLLYMEDISTKRAMLAEIIGKLFHSLPMEILQFFIGKISYFWTSPQALNWSVWNAEDSMQILPGV